MPRRILAINWQDLKNPQGGGAEVHLHEIISRLGQWGHDVTLLCCGFDGAPVEERYDHIRVVRRGKRADFNLVAPFAARELMKRERFDIVIEDINKIPIYTPLFSSPPILAVVPHLFATTVFHEINFLLASYIYFMEFPVKWFYRNTPFMVISESTKGDLVARGIPRDMIRVVHCGIDHAVYCPDARFEKTPEPTITYVGRLKRYKSVDHIFAALPLILKDFPNVRVEVIGTGDDDGRLRQRAEELGVADRVTFAGYVPVTQKVETLRRSWVVVCPSLKEGWGLTNIEANACGAPVVCANVPGLRDSAIDGETGLLYPYGDTTEECSAMPDCESASWKADCAGRTGSIGIRRPGKPKRLLSRWRPASARLTGKRRRR
ncbi:MAG: glycosyltransferase family 4 protein [candidate division Zixibacteria bacterium]|nr:glycosyltransferase family 4 protein [candidate division Zixibacteria bacterium]